MSQILSIALHEISRLRKRFSGGASPLAVVILLSVLGLSALALRQITVLGNGLYRVGVSGDVPSIQDGRFAVIAVAPSQGRALLDQGAIDVFIDGAQVSYRDEEKSLYAIGALRRYLEKREIERISQAYDVDLAFPLRVGVRYLALAPPEASSPQASETQTPAPQETDAEVIIPSLMTPRAPFAQVVLSLIFILPVTFISIFFTSSFMDEKLNRRLVILLSAPVTPSQIIIGKMLPYAVFALAATAFIALATRADVLAALAIFTPAILFMFAIYLMVPLFYRTFKDTTFISMLVTTLTTAFLVAPAMFNGVSDLAYMSPLTLAVKMYRGEPYGWREYLFPSLPMAAIFGLALYAGTRLLNEEFLMGYRPITQKVKDAIYLVMTRSHPYRSVGLLSFVIIPVVYLVQLVILAISSNLPPSFMLLSMLLTAALIEEIVKSIGIVVWLERGVVSSVKGILALAFLSALGFLLGEKLLLLFSISMVSQSALASALFNTGFLLVPLLAHFVFTAGISLLTAKTRLNYPLALVIGTVLHSFYNWFLVRGL